MEKQLETLVPDIYAVLDDSNHHEPNEENLEALGRNVVELVRARLSERGPDRSPLRFSNLGKPDRQLWYAANMPEIGERLSPKVLFKFLYGDVIEQLVLFLAKEAGHDVQREQEEIEVDGVKGHIDAIIDGVTVDVKSASPFAFKKFKERKLFDDDPFGYVGQISGYAETLTPGMGGAFLAADKVHGDLTVMKVDADTTRLHEPKKRIAHLKEVVASKEIPARCYDPVPEGKSGNMKLGTNCSYCAFKNECWKDANDGKGLRTFLYYSGPTFLTHVEKEPMVPELKEDYSDDGKFPED
jgi:hypothetical protein